jgi:flagellar biosynthetic protein FlhB
VYLITGAIAFSPQALRPKFQRIDPIAQAKQKYGSLGLVEFAKTFVKFLAIGAGLVLVLYAFLPTIMLSLHASPGQVTLAMGVLLWRLLLITTGIALVIGLADLFWQNYSHTKKLRMSHQDLRDETKEAEGDPFLKAQRRKRGEDIATNQMLTDMADSSVVIVNPTHYAVALRWNVAMGGAPVCVAKGTDEIAARMREVAAEHGIPIRHDPPTARALHATVRLGQQIPRDLYHAVAAALRYADDLRNLKPGRGP